MSPRSAHLRFLLRGSLLLTGILALWWLALQPPLLFLLRVSEETVMSLLPGAGPARAIAVDAAGDWNFRVPVDDTRLEAGSLVRVDSVEFTIPRHDVLLFTFSLPLFWALMLAAPDVRSHLAALLWGTGALAAFEVLLLLGFVEINARGMVGWSGRWLELATYLATSVLPFFAPLAAALALHRDLRALIFPSRT